MAWEKSPPALIARFDEVVPDDPRVERRKMFGYPCAFVQGNMFMGLHQSNMILRLDEAGRDDLKARHGAAPFEPMAGRVMREYVALPAAVLDDNAALSDWVRRSLAFALSLPPKEKKPRKRKARA